MKKSKRLRGSAYTAEDGTFVFTPYASVPASEKSMRMVQSSRFSTLWVGKKTVSVRLCFNRKFIPPYNVWIEELTYMYNELIARQNEL